MPLLKYVLDLTTKVCAENTYFIRASITVWLTLCLTGLDSTKFVNLYLIQHKQSS